MSWVPSSYRKREERKEREREIEILLWNYQNELKVFYNDVTNSLNRVEITTNLCALDDFCYTESIICRNETTPMN